MREAVARSRVAFESWREVPIADRAKLLHRVADGLAERAQELGHIITSEMGRVWAGSIPEVTKAASFFRYFVDNTEWALAPTPLNLDGLTLPENAAQYFMSRGESW